MNYALIKDGIVKNVIDLHPMNANDFPGAIPADGVAASIGDTYTDGVFYRDGVEVKPYAVAKSEEMDDMHTALVELGVSAEANWTDAAKPVRDAMDVAGAMLTDEQAATAVALYRHWESGIEYAAGDRRTHNGTLYKCLQAHTAQETWNPAEAPSLWAKVLIPDPDVIPEWEQPDSTNPYMKGDKVTHNGKTWVSLVDNNVWEPGAVGTESLWSEVA